MHSTASSLGVFEDRTNEPAQQLAPSSQKHSFEDSKEIKIRRLELDLFSNMMPQNLGIPDVKQRYCMGK